ncbi:hypothetical protein Droror1_Dr00002764 [Drosera rotundifolia]
MRLRHRKLKEKTTVNRTQSGSSAGNIGTMVKFGGIFGEIKVGEFYEIDRSKSPPRTPRVLLLSVRVVKVTNKTELNVTVEYPSIKSLDAFFDDERAKTSDSAKVPTMDEKFIMAPQLANAVLVRRIPSREVMMNCDCKSFWLVHAVKDETFSLPVSACNSMEDEISKKGICLFKLQGSGVLGWGTRRVISYGDAPSSISPPSIDVGEPKKEEGVETDEAVTRSTRQLCLSNGKGNMELTIHKCNQLSRNLKKNSKKDKMRLVDNSRWTAERYDRGRKELLEVLKTKGAYYGNAISRCTLRQEARKQIGDTGLLDHLLKHVAGEVAPDGIYRFRRRFDPDGFMEYWLESADLANIRREAGVDDPYWSPPPGWSPGDPICKHGAECTAEIKQLREELAKMKKEMQELGSVDEGDLMALDFVPDCLNSVTVEPFEFPDIGLLSPSELKEKYEEMLERKSEAEKQLSSISDAIRDMEFLLTTQSQQA